MSINRIIQQAAAGVSTSTPIGAEINGGFFAGIIDTTVGNIIAADDYQTGARYALIVSPKEYAGGAGESPAAGLPTGQLLWDSLDRTGQSGSFTRWNGLESTESILAKNDTRYEVFEFIRDLRSAYPVPSDGGSDWYVPAMDELELMYRNLKTKDGNNSTGSISVRTFPGTSDNHGYNPSSDPTGAAYTISDPSQTSVTAFQAGGAEEIFPSEDAWSSTDANAFGRVWVHSSSGFQNAVGKNVTDKRLRPVRRILL